MKQEYFIKQFKEISKNDTSSAGGKGASLGEMTQAGIPIPSGFVVLSAAFENFIEGTPGRHGCLKSDIDAILHNVDHQKIHTVEEASEKIQGIILSSEIPKQIAEEIINSFSQLKSEFVAVRSSATAEDSSSAAWAGQLDTFLNTNKQNLLENVKKCWASLFTPRAIFYRFEKGLHGQKISVAVVVQKMVQSEVAGIAFSVHPVTQDKNQLIIEAAFGLGEAVVSGQITPDSYVVEKKNWFVLDIHVAEQEKGLYKKLNGGNKWKELKEGGKQKLTGQQIIELSRLIVAIENHYGFPCDIEWALEKGKFYVVQSRPITTLENTKKSIGSSPIDFKNRKWVVYGGSGWPVYLTPFAVVPSRKFFEIHGIENEAVVLWKGKVFDWLYEENQLVEFAKYILPELLEKQWAYYDHWRTKAERFVKLHYQLFDINLSKVDDTELHDWMKKYYDTFVTQYEVNNVIEPLSFYFQNQLQKLLKDKGIVGRKAEQLSSIYGSPIKSNYIKQCLEDYKKVKTGKEVANLLKKYHYINNDYTGSRKITVYDLKKLIYKNLNYHYTNPKHQAIPKKAKDLLSVLQIVATIQDVRKAESLMWVTGAEKIAIEVARRRSIPVEELLFATWDELIENNFTRNELKRRRDCCVVHWQFQKTNVYSGDQAVKIITDFRQSILGDAKDIQEFKGFPASSGIIKGRAVIVLNVSQFHKVREGDILVTAMTRPEYLPVMRLAAAFVTNEGGITSHAAIVAREMKKPCIIGTKIATLILKDGDLVEVDADKGVVKIIKRKV